MTEIHWNDCGLEDDQLQEEKLDGVTDEEAAACLKLYVANNSLTRLPHSIFRRFRNLEALYATGNRLRTLPDSAREAPALRRVELMQNEFPEGCNRRAKNREEVLALLDELQSHGRLELEQQPVQQKPASQPEAPRAQEAAPAASKASPRAASNDDGKGCCAVH